MKSSTGQYFVALDHIRSLALFMVFTWHFMHGVSGSPVPFNQAVLFPFAIIDEGHVGVALFMTLSGYLFAKLLDGKDIDYGAFLWNRMVRLLPLLIVIIIVVGIGNYFNGQDLRSYVMQIAKGLFLPTLPNGGWSITTEFHYYLILPIFIWLLRRSKFLPFALIVAAIGLRLGIFLFKGEVQSLAYWTIVGRIDQFALGMLLFQSRAFFKHRHLLVITVLSLFAVFYWQFDALGGFYNMPSYPSPSAIWVYLPTIEGIAFATGIAWYV
ncbi:MAG: acyltransferase [Candidatus Omnitrophica bacterium]|nr:acyltransferase [Candidatus Omnitrophota bacterium]